MTSTRSPRKMAAAAGGVVRYDADSGGGRDATFASRGDHDLTLALEAETAANRWVGLYTRYSFTRAPKYFSHIRFVKHPLYSKNIRIFSPKTLYIRKIFEYIFC